MLSFTGSRLDRADHVRADPGELGSPVRRALYRCAVVVDQFSSSNQHTVAPVARDVVRVAPALERPVALQAQFKPRGVGHERAQGHEGNR